MNSDSIVSVEFLEDYLYFLFLFMKSVLEFLSRPCNVNACKNMKTKMYLCLFEHLDNPELITVLFFQK